MAYGDGPHYCIGAAAARATLRATFAEIFRTVGSFEILEPPAHLLSNVTAGIKRMIVPAAPASENGARVGLEGLAWR